MKLRVFLTESENITDKILKNCSFYLNLLKSESINMPFCRGIKGIIAHIGNNDIGIQDTITRTSKGTRIFIGDEGVKKMNDWLEEKGHVRRDKAIFLSSHINRAKFFGHPFYIFPVGKFDYTWIKSADFNMSDSIRNCLKVLFKDRKEYKPEVIDYHDDLLNNLLHTNEDINTPFKQYFEIWMNPKQYYYVDYTLKDYVKEILAR